MNSIILLTKSGYALYDYFSIMPEGELVVTNNPRLLKICGLYVNKITIIQQEIGETPTEILWQLIEKK